MISEKESWMGPKGFDEAKYYRDEKSDIGITHSDARIKAEILEAIKRSPLQEKESLNVYVSNGIVEIGGRVINESVRDDILKTISSLTGVKSIISSIDLLTH